jgi:hypothetical protein
MRLVHDAMKVQVRQHLGPAVAQRAHVALFAHRDVGPTGKAVQKGDAAVAALGKVKVRS